MTKDVIALTPRMPDSRSIIAALLSAGPDFHVQSVAEGAVLQLCDGGGRPLMSVESPILVQVPGETARLLGADADAVTTPTWWVEARASTAALEGERIAAAFASNLARQLDGTVWPADAALPPHNAAPVKADTTVVPTPAAAQPAVDVLTDRVAVVIQNRPVVPMTSWLSDTLRACITSGRALQIVTPPDARLSLPTRTALTGLPNRWVIRDPNGTYYDGLSGAQLHWNDGAFTLVPAPSGETPIAHAFTTPDAAHAGEGQLLLSFTTCHPATDDLLLGGALESAWRTLTGAPPAGWATAEPVNLPWSRPDITRLARHRAPDDTWITTVGSPDCPAIATMRVSRTEDGVEEDITLAVGYRKGQEIAEGELASLAGELVTNHNLRSLLAQHRTARCDLTVPPHVEGIPTPFAFALGPQPVEDAGPAHASRPPLPTPPQPLGPPDRPGLYYRLDTADATAGWKSLEQLTRHLGEANIMRT
ncbi:DUF6177 family protein [Streptomyces sp. RPT161]|uniref:DUF6177 family protein n=1 Tax=Streptomyces sp. RPT161 TaxID=3015993 RepID=UPI0022B8C641|nr:DUF6177 family protein [Streptomyces sp. RPT161]